MTDNPIAFSKKAAHDFFLAADIPQPRDFPEGSEPYIVKPDEGRCGFGIWATEDFCEAGGAVNADFLVQEELTGPIVSVQLLSAGGQKLVCPPVQLSMDDRYDRCGASFPCEAAMAAAVTALAGTVAKAAEFDGAMELKAVYHGGRAYALSLNDGIGALADTALQYGADCHPARALERLARGKTPVFAEKTVQIRHESGGRVCGMRSAGELILCQNGEETRLPSE